MIILSAEDYLQSVEAVPNYGLMLLKLLDSPECEMFIRVAAAVNFKNFVKRNWRIVSIMQNEPGKSSNIYQKFIALNTSQI